MVTTPGMDLLLARASSRRGGPSLGAGGVPTTGVAVVACMDARLQVEALFGLQAGEAHVIRNAGGVVTEDVVRSLLLSQRLLGTREVMIVQHTDCGMARFSDDELQEQLLTETGQRFPGSLGAFTDLDDSVRAAMTTVRDSPLLPSREAVRGFVFDVVSGELREVSP